MCQLVPPAKNNESIPTLQTLDNLPIKISIGLI